MLSFFYYAVVVWVISISGNPLVSSLGKYVPPITALSLVFLGTLRGLRLREKDYLIILVFLIICLWHSISFGGYVVPSGLGFLSKLLIGLMALRVIPDFTNRLINAIFILSLISLVIYLFRVVGLELDWLKIVEFEARVGENAQHGLVYNFRIETDVDYLRNMGMFWEPGAYAGYLILALVFLEKTRENRTIKKNSRLEWIFYATLITTMSTTGFIGMAFLLGNKIFRYYRKPEFRFSAARFVFLPIVLVMVFVIGWTAYSKISFLGTKISEQLIVANNGSSESKITRFGNALFDLNWVYQRPLLGWSATPETRTLRDQDVGDLIQEQGNGLTGFAVRFGLVGLFTYFVLINLEFRKSRGTAPVANLLTLLIATLLIGEQFLNFPLFLMLMFGEDGPQGRRSK